MSNYQPYIYLIGWSNLDRWYVGSRYARNCSPDDLWKSYFTSSKMVTAVRYLYGEPDMIQTYPVEDKKDALTRECVVMFYVGAVEQPRWLNQANTIQSFHEGKLPHRQSAATRRKQGKARKGRKLTPEHIANSVAGRAGQTRSAAWKAEHSERMKGKGRGVPKPGTSQKLKGRSMFLAELESGSPSKRAIDARDKAQLVHDAIREGLTITETMKHAGVSEDTVLKVRRGDHWSHQAIALGHIRA
jgi:hypothetical protein